MKELTPFQRAVIELYAITGNAAVSYLILGGRENEKKGENAIIPIIEDYNSIPQLYTEYKENIRRELKQKGKTDKQIDKHITQLEKDAYHRVKGNPNPTSLEEGERKGGSLLHKPIAQKYYDYCLEHRSEKLIAQKNEILGFYTAVMRGQVLDQFGIEASLDTRIKAANELSKWQIEIPLKLEMLKQQQANNEVGSVTLNFKARAIEG